jgi:hypothetical protein
MPPALEVVPELRVVVELTVVSGPYRARLLSHRLVSSFVNVDDAQPRMFHEKDDSRSRKPLDGRRLRPSLVQRPETVLEPINPKRSP